MICYVFGRGHFNRQLKNPIWYRNWICARFAGICVRFAGICARFAPQFLLVFSVRKLTEFQG